nr:T9SS type A sorting domain-containing protein [Bacteroidota bacterium]
NGYSMNVGGDWNNLVGDEGFMESNGMVTFYGPHDADIISDETFYNLRINKTHEGSDGLELGAGKTANILNDLELSVGTFRLKSATSLTVNEDLYIFNDACLHAGEWNMGNTIGIGGNWTNENSDNSDTTGFMYGDATVTFFGEADKVLVSNSEWETFQNVKINKFLWSIRPESNIEVRGDFEIIDGALWDNIPGLTHQFKGDFTVQGWGSYLPQGITAFNGFFDDQNYTNYGQAKFKEVVLSKPAVKSLTLHSQMVIEEGYQLLIWGGLLNLNGQWLMAKGDINLINYGTIKATEGSRIVVGTGLFLNDYSNLLLAGTSDNYVQLYGYMGNYFPFEINSGTTISAEYTHFQYMDANGIWIKDGAIVDPDHAFNNCIIDAGINSASSSRIWFNNNQVLTCTDVDFPNNPGISNAHNVSKSQYALGQVTFINATGDFSGEQFEFDPYGLIDWEIQLTTQTLNIPAGWSGISSYILPENPDLGWIFNPVAPILIIAQNFQGFYFPDQLINTIGPWTSHSAYQVKMMNDVQLDISGYVETNLTINIPQGWSMLPVPNSCGTGIDSLFTAAGQQPQIIKEVAGSRIYWPAMGISTLSILEPGKAYFILSSSQMQVTFANCDNNIMKNHEVVETATNPWNELIPTASSHSIAFSERLAKQFEQGDIIGVFTSEGICAGFASVQNDNAFAVTAFADDPLTAEEDGFINGEPIRFKIYSTAKNAELDIVPIFDPDFPNADGSFATNGLSLIGEVKMQSVEIAAYSGKNSVSVYPNPCSGRFTISGLDNANRIEILNVNGTKIFSHDSLQEKSKEFDFTDRPPGVYLVRILSNGNVVTKKLVIN